jgi:asparagine synthase (glutamine-hydrolysing)
LTSTSIKKIDRETEVGESMSALAGILNFGNTPPSVDPNRIAQLGLVLDSRGPDGGRDVVVGNVGMSYRAYHTTPESRFECQPHISPEGHILAWNGRLDNRDELIRQVGDQIRSESSPITDLEIVMAAYLGWGERCFGRLVGDFCLALWDPDLKVLHLVCDPVGTRSINFQISDERIIWATELVALLRFSEISLEVDDKYVIGFLYHEPKPGLTPYKKIFAVKPAHVLTIGQDGRFQQRSFWRLDCNKEIRYKSDRDYEEHFLHEFCDGLKGRLRSHLPVFAEASGGLDSSSIVCAADWIMEHGDVHAPGLETISHIYDESPTSDESRFVRCIEEQRGQVGNRLKESEYPILAPFADERAVWIPNGLQAFDAYYRGLCETMRAKGARVVLSGEGGDEMIGSSDDPSPELADLLVQGKIGDLHKRLVVWSQALRRPYLWLLWQRATVPVLPSKLRSLWKPTPVGLIPCWLKPMSLQGAGLRDAYSGVADIYGFRLPSGQDQARGFISISRHISAGYRRERTHVETAYPFTHRPLVEFLQAIPFEQRVRPGETRSLMRRALRNILPKEVLRRRTKGSAKEALCRALARERPRLQRTFTDSRLSARGYIDSEKLLEALCHAAQGLETHFVLYLKVFSLELWLRTLERDRADLQSLATARGTLAEGGRGSLHPAYDDSPNNARFPAI